MGIVNLMSDPRFKTRIKINPKVVEFPKYAMIRDQALSSSLNLLRGSTFNDKPTEGSKPLSNTTLNLEAHRASNDLVEGE